MPTQLVFVDTAVPDYPQLVDQILTSTDDSNVVIYLLDSTSDGVEQITDILTQYTDVTAVHLISHGSPGSLQLGNSVLNSEHLADYSEALGTWGQSLTVDADFLIYGCDVAATSSGENFVNSLAQLTGADVAASNDLTGASALGGDWELEHQVGEIETPDAIAQVVQDNWKGTLSTTYIAQDTSNSSDLIVKSAQNWGQSFSYTSGNGTYNVNQISIMLQGTNAVDDPVISVSLEDSYGGTVLGSDSIIVNQSDTTLVWYTFEFGDVTLTDGVEYYIRVNSDMATSGNVQLAYDGSGGSLFANGDLLTHGGSTDTSKDLTFRLSLVKNEAPIFDSTGPFTVDENLVAGTVVGDIDANDGDGAGTGPGYLVISEIMYDPASPEDNWEWIEVYNSGSEPIDLTGFVLDDINSVSLTGANISGGQVDPGETAVLFNVDDVNAAAFEAAWGTGINLIPVTQWDALPLNNDGDQLSLWENYADYTGDHETHANAFLTIKYTDLPPWPAPDHLSSIFLNDLDADPTDGVNWEISTDGASTPMGDNAYQSTASGSNTGTDVGSPGAGDPGSGITYSITTNVNPDSDGNDAFTIDSATGVITVNDSDDLDYETNSSLTITIEADDGILTSTTNVVISLNPVNDNDPVADDKSLTVLQGSTATEADLDTGTSLLDGDTDADLPNDTLTVNSSPVAGPSHGSLTLNTNGTFTYIHDGTNNFTDSFTYELQDADGGVADNGTVTITINPVNNAPTATNLTTNSSYNEGDATVSITDIVVSDVDASESITATLTLADTNTGSLSTNDGATYDGITGIWTINDTLANVNTALANLVFNPNLNNDLDTNIGVVIDDGDEDLSGPLNGTITLDVNPINDAPSINSAAGYGVNEDDNYRLLGGLSIDDIDANGADLQVTLEVIDGVLKVDNTAGLTSITGNDSDSVMLIGTITDINGALASLKYKPNPDYAGSDNLSFTVNDLGNTGSAGPQVTTKNVPLIVTAINDSPTARNLTTTSSYNEGDATVTLTDIVVGDVDVSESITATLTLADTSTGSLSANDGATYDGTTGIWTISDTLANVNTALANLVFNPNLNNDIDTSIGVMIDDGDEDASGPLTGTISLNVIPTNDAPAINTNNPLSVSEEGTRTITSAYLETTDVDTPSDQIKYTHSQRYQVAPAKYVWVERS